MSLADRLRAIVPATRPAAVPPPPSARAGAEALGGEWREFGGHRYLVLEQAYPPGTRHGMTSIADAAPGDDGSWPALAALDESVARRRLLFVDLETTGLAGGAGTYAFLIGCGWFDGASFRVRQLLLASYGAERGLLEELARAASSAGALATYNGKTFDLPLVETRFALHRMAHPFDAVPHVDLLHPARRLWRARDAADGRSSCGLGAVEAAVLGVSRDDDVPGFEIPGRYFHYVRTGDARPLAAVLEHNRLDLLSLALLTARAALLLDAGAPAARTAREALGLGRLFRRAGRPDDARACFARAVSMSAGESGGDWPAHAEALREYASACRRAARHAEAADAWTRALALPACPPRIAQEASEALAVHHEHRRRDPQAARRFAAASLGFAASPAQTLASRHRLARLDRKLRGQPEPAPLFGG